MFTPKSPDPLPTSIGPAPERKKPTPVDKLIGEWLWQLPDGKLAYRPPEPTKEEVKKEEPKTPDIPDDYKYATGVKSGRLYRYNGEPDKCERGYSVFAQCWRDAVWSSRKWYGVNLITREEAVARFPDAFR